MTYRILVTGSRDFDDELTVGEAIRVAAAVAAHNGEEVVVVHGNATGADSLAVYVAGRLGFEVEVHVAEWSRYGNAAGPIRNAEMVAAGADICLAFFKEGSLNRGTADCANRATAADIPTVRFTR